MENSNDCTARNLLAGNSFQHGSNDLRRLRSSNNYNHGHYDSDFYSGDDTAPFDVAAFLDCLNTRDNEHNHDVNDNN